ncbi:hypothetical protein MPER_09290 [Moniliophthora perniciosa FA553]|nr:hypothetical protein MPER_09290 [Moniliophthora perniciosa FA553]
MPTRYSLKNPLNFNLFSMAANSRPDNSAQFEDDLRNFVFRHTCKLDHNQLDRERLEREARLASLSHQVAELTLKLSEAQSTITALSGAAATLSSTTSQLASLRTQVEFLQSELDTSHHHNRDLEQKLDREERMFADVCKDLQAKKEECAQLRVKATLAKQTEKDARKKIKAAYGMLKDDDDDVVVSFHFDTHLTGLLKAIPDCTFLVVKGFSEEDVWGSRRLVVMRCYGFTIRYVLFILVGRTIYNRICL